MYPAHWEPFFRALRKLTPEPPEILALASRTFADPLRTGAAAAPELERILATLPVRTTRRRSSASARRRSTWTGLQTIGKHTGGWCTRGAAAVPRAGISAR